MGGDRAACGRKICNVLNRADRDRAILQGDGVNIGNLADSSGIAVTGYDYLLVGIRKACDISNGTTVSQGDLGLVTGQGDTTNFTISCGNEVATARLGQI